ncbi:hypothetical protein ACJ6WF_46475 [Streptomyces sp. MMS24-I2-30]|uniref:hypothetical protein n=1 Tax=Streptomyces sp. MMS24-I2-30 TaxID=3351564 RepID=UPI003896ECDA
MTFDVPLDGIRRRVDDTDGTAGPSSGPPLKAWHTGPAGAATRTARDSGSPIPCPGRYVLDGVRVGPL